MTTVIWTLCALSGAFSLISWPFITQFEHNTYQIEAGYLSYQMISVISLLTRNSKIQVVMSTFHLRLVANANPVSGGIWALREGGMAPSS